MGEGRKLFLFVYQFLVDMETFLQAAQDVSSPKIPFIFEELEFIIHCDPKSGRQPLTLGHSIKIKKTCRDKEKVRRQNYLYLLLFDV